LVPAWYPRGCVVRGALLVVERDGGPVYYAKWRDAGGRQVKRRLGSAWLVRDGRVWRPRRGRAPAGSLDERAAVVLMASVIETHEEAVRASAPSRRATFADAAALWLHHLEHVKGVKPSTLDDYRYLLAPPDAPARKRGKMPAARIMRAFGDRPLASITALDVARYLSGLDDDPTVAARTVNKHRQVLSSVFEHAMREDTFGLLANPTWSADKRRSRTRGRSTSTRPRRCSRWRGRHAQGCIATRNRPAVSDAERSDRERCDEQDAALFIVAAFTGLRMGELLALRWRHVDFADAKLVVEASWSAGRLTSPKSRKWRAVPLADQPAAVLAQLAARERFAGREDLVFCNEVGRRRSTGARCSPTARCSSTARSPTSAARSRSPQARDGRSSCASPTGRGTCCSRRRPRPRLSARTFKVPGRLRERRP